MRAITYASYGPVDRLEETDVPRPEPGRREILVRVTRAALNPKDAIFRSGRYRFLSGSRFPKRSGVDFAGVVEASRSPHFREGQRVFGMLDELTYRRGTLAEFVACKDHEAARLPDAISEEAGASAALVALTAVQALRDVGRTAPGSRVLVHGGSGGVGTVAIQIARILGAEVDATSSARNLDFCRSLGAARAWDYASTDLYDAHPRFDVVFDVFGNLRFASALPTLEPRGAFISTIATAGRIARDVLTRFSRVQQRIVAVRARRADLELVASWMESGKLRAIIDSRFPLGRVREAFAVSSRSARAGRSSSRSADRSSWRMRPMQVSPHGASLKVRCAHPGHRVRSARPGHRLVQAGHFSRPDVSSAPPGAVCRRVPCPGWPAELEQASTK
jgi:NADPH:quinone reductase-like Zn-dependent oxidoreductase